jgi:hypothetical protein
MLKVLLLAGGLLFATLPNTTNYMINSYSFGSGGGANSTTSNYALEGSTGTLAGPSSSTTTYSVKPEFIETQQANVPKISSFDNGSGTYYNKLHFVLDQQNNPTDATYALSISTDNFSSDIRYVKSDFTVGATLTTADYLTYGGWGGSSGSNIIGLLPNTTYYLKAKATQGKFTESGYGPVVSASTVGPQLSFSISTTTVALGNLPPTTVVNAPQTIDIGMSTNAGSGGDVYISGQNGGLHSVSASSTISSASGDLSSLSNGFGAQVTSVSQSSGGPFSKIVPYDGTSDVVGLTNSTIRKIISTSNPIAGGTGSILLKAKSASTDQVANDYQEILTILASASF